MSKALKVSVLLKGKELSSQTFQKDRIVIGRDADCDLRLENVGVSRHHARIERKGPGYLLRDLGSSNGTIVGHETVALWPIRDGGRARITKFDLDFRVVDEPEGEVLDRDTPLPGLTDQETLSLDRAEPGATTGIFPLSETRPKTGWSASRATVTVILGAGLVAGLIYLVSR